MNRRLCVRVFSVLSCTLIFACCASGQAPPPPTAPVSVLPPGVQAEQPVNPTDLLAVKKFISDQIALLTGPSSTAQSTARKAIIAQLSPGSTPDFYSKFAAIWSVDATAILAKNPSVSVRLNIAIVTRTLTESGRVMDPKPLVIALIKDKDPCVALWGIKAARPIIELLLQAPPIGGKAAVLADPIVPAIIDAVRRAGDTQVAGIVTTDAYNTLIVDDNHPIVGLSQQQAAPLVPPLVGPILDIVDFRLNQYVTGVRIEAASLSGPQAPGAERIVGTFLSTNYSKVSSTLQTRIIQDLVNLVTLLGERAALYQNSKDDLAQIRDTLRYATSALRVLVPSADKDLSWLEPPPPASTPKEILDHTKLVYAVIAKDPQFKSLTAPPKIQEIEPPPPPETPKPAAPGTAPNGPPAQ